MKLALSTADSLSEALEWVEFLEPRLMEAVEPMLVDEPQPGLLRAFFERSFDDPECLLVLAREPGEPRVWGAAVCGAFVDPLSAQRVPMLLGLWVDPSLRHRGVARGLQEEARRILAARGLRDFATRAAYNDDALVSMGERWGYLRHWEFMLGEL